MAYFNEGDLPWQVEVLQVTGRGSSDYWTVTAKFAGEADAWQYGARYTRARVTFKGEVVGKRAGGLPGSNAWGEPE